MICPALAPLFYWRLLTTDLQDVATLPPGDITDLHYPYHRWVAEQMARGEPPWWNQFLSAGHSAVGDIQFHTLYPPDSALAAFAGGSLSFRLFEEGIIAHVALGAFFMYLLGRRLTGSRVGGLVAGVVFGFGGYLSGFTVQQMILLETSIWLPLILLAVDLGASYNLVAAFVVGAIGIAMAALAGHPQTLFYVALAAGCYALFRGWNGGRPRLAVFLGLPILMVGGIGLAADALLPAFLHLDLTDRTNVTYAFSNPGFDLHEALGIVFPVQFGGAPLYNGLFTLFLVGVGLMARRRRSDKLFWVGLGIAGLLFSFGGKTFLESITYLGLGSFKFRDHERLAFYVSVAVGLLAAYGAADLARNARLELGWLRREMRWPFVLVGAALVLVLVSWQTTPRGQQHDLFQPLDRLALTAIILIIGAALLLAREKGIVSPSAAGILAITLVAFDLFSTNWQNNLAPGDPEMMFSTSPLVEYLQSYSTGVFRISSEGLLPGDGNGGALFRLEDLVGNSPLETRDYAEFDRVVTEIVRWQVLNVRYVITQRKIDDPRLHLLRQDGPRYLYQLDDKLQVPRANIVTHVVPAPSHHDALEILKSIDVHTEAVVEGPIDLSSLSGSSASSTPMSTASPDGAGVLDATEDFRTRLDLVEANQVVVDTQLSKPGLFVLADVDYPGWHAQVDGVESKIYRTNGIVRGVLLPSGHHVVRFAFVPPGLIQGEFFQSRIQWVLPYVVAAEIGLRVIWLIVVTLRHLARRARSLDVSKVGPLA